MPISNQQWRSTYYYEEVGPQASPRDTLRVDGSGNHRSFRVEWGKDGVQVAALSRQTAAKDFLGYSQVRPTQADATRLYLSRVVSFPDPDWLSGVDPLGPPPSALKPFMWAESLEFEPMGVPTDSSATTPEFLMKSAQGSAVYKEARCRITFTTRSYDILPDYSGEGYLLNTFPLLKGLPSMPLYDVGTAGGEVNLVPDESSLARYVTKQIRPAAENLSFTGAGGAFQFAGGGGVPLNTIIIKRAAHDLILTWHQVPTRAVGSRILQLNSSPAVNLLSAPIDDFPGSVNLYPIWGYPQGTLLLDNPSLEPHVDAFGNRVWEIEYHFRYEPHWVLEDNPTPPPAKIWVARGHNWFFDKQTGDYRELVKGGTASPPSVDDQSHVYPYNDFSLLFKVPY